VTTFARASRPESQAATARGVLVRWAISRSAMHRARPDLVSSPAGGEVVLAWRVEADREGALSGEAALVDGAATTPLLSVIGGHLAGRDSIDIPGLLAVSLHGAADCGRVRYARTSLFDLWAVPGGRYELLRDGRGG
jgi:hypothetical protein